MIRFMRSRLTSAHAIAMVALFAALGGGAYAAVSAPKNSVGSKAIKNGQVKTGDLGRNAVRSKHVKNGQIRSADVADGSIGTVDVTDGGLAGADIADGQVGSADIGDGQVTGADIADGQVGSGDIGDGQVTGADIADGQIGSADLAPSEAFRLVGALGQPPFGNGGEGDCNWSNPTVPGATPADPYHPAAFYKSPDGTVHLAGVAQAKNGAGGDATCGGGDDALADATIFTLPPAYRPAKLLVFAVAGGTATQLAVSGEQTIVSGTTTIPPGTVFLGTGGAETTLALDGVDFRAAAPAAGVRTAGKTVRVSPRMLRLLLGVG